MENVSGIHLFLGPFKIAKYDMQQVCSARSMKQEPQRHELHFNSYRLFAAPAVVIFLFWPSNLL